MNADQLEFVTRIFVVLHLIGMASLLSGFLTQMKEFKTGARITPAIFHGAWTLLVTGFVLVGLVMASADETTNDLVLAAKAIVITAVFFVAYGYNKKSVTPKWAVPTIGLLTILNICLAVFGPIVVNK